MERERRGRGCGARRGARGTTTREVRNKESGHSLLSPRPRTSKLQRTLRCNDTEREKKKKGVELRERGARGTTTTRKRTASQTTRRGCGGVGRPNKAKTYSWWPPPPRGGGGGQIDRRRRLHSKQTLPNPLRARRGQLPPQLRHSLRCSLSPPRKQVLKRSKG